jgi:hypothetical protein
MKRDRSWRLSRRALGDPFTLGLGTTLALVPFGLLVVASAYRAATGEAFFLAEPTMQWEWAQRRQSDMAIRTVTLIVACVAVCRRMIIQLTIRYFTEPKCPWVVFGGVTSLLGILLLEVLLYFRNEYLFELVPPRFILVAATDAVIAFLCLGIVASVIRALIQDEIVIPVTAFRRIVSRIVPFAAMSLLVGLGSALFHDNHIAIGVHILTLEPGTRAGLLALVGVGGAYAFAYCVAATARLLYTQPRAGAFASVFD